MPRLLGCIVFAFSAASALAAPWPNAASDLPPHPGLREGRLANGLRHLTLANAEPRDRISLRLVVAAGAVHEADDERGLAHFVEHMAFRSTRTHPAGTLVAALQRLGLGLGPDSAAFTHHGHTIYHLELPDATEATLREGLRVFREYAEEVTFDPALLETERGVILSEKATRDTPEARNGEANLAFLFPGSLQARRGIIGTTASIRALTREQFVAFYDAWYRPERLAVVAVGAVKPDEIARLVEEELGGLRPRGEPRPEPQGITPAQSSSPDVAIFADAGLIGVGLTFQRPLATPHGPDTHARRVRSLHETLAFAMFHARLTRNALDPATSFVAPFAHLSASLPGWRVATLTVSGKIDDWRKVANDVEREHRRAFIHGFTATELTEARANFINSFEQAVRTIPTWPSPWLSTRIAETAVRGEVFVSPDSHQRDVAADLAVATLADCQQAFRDVWSNAAPHVFVSANPLFKITRQEIGDALNASRLLPAPPQEDAPPPVFAYTNFGPAGRVVRDELLPDLDVRLAEFANGVRYNFKSTPFEADTIEIRLRVGEGHLSLPPQQAGLDLLASTLLTAGGLGRHSADEISRIVAGRTLGYSFQVLQEASQFSARCSRRDLTLCLQLLAAHLTDSAFRPEAMREAGARFGSLYSSLASSPGGPITLLALRTMLRGDTRFGPPLAPELGQRTIAELANWLDPQLKHGAVELSLVGDISWEDASAALAATVGALPTRRPRADTRTAAKAVKFAKPVAAPELYGIDAKLGRAAIACYWPVPDLKDAPEERRCRVLAQVLADRLRVRLREELGTAYSPSAGFVDNDGFSAVNYFVLYAEVEPARTQQALTIIQRETASLAAQGPTADEFIRAHQPYLHQMSDDRRTNAYWGGTVLADAQLHPHRLSSARDRSPDVAAITAADLAKLAKRHFTAKNIFTFMTVPEFSPAPGAPPR